MRLKIHCKTRKLRQKVFFINLISLDCNNDMSGWLHAAFRKRERKKFNSSTNKLLMLVSRLCLPLNELRTVVLFRTHDKVLNYITIPKQTNKQT